MVERPSAGDTISSPVHVAGEASVFEATLFVRVRDAQGQSVGEATITASTGAPDRGTFAGDVPFDVDEKQDGTVEVFSPSAEDGSEQHKVTVPVRLEP